MSGWSVDNIVKYALINSLYFYANTELRAKNVLNSQIDMQGNAMKLLESSHFVK